ncbi:hypothetical protein ABW20_dc0100039 [Dactylellina cionopaga]|nr:hypothetical protein ABW20_dc0100039 [Dactylellina cionopaga]
MPEVTEGPYFVSGEYVRTDISEGQKGVTLYLDIQVIDTNTCEPVTDAYFDAWHTNATGVYSGVIASGNGDGSNDPTNLNNTFCRGVQFTDADGVIKFKTVFPGHYSGRTTHVHIMSHKGGTVYPNGTYGSTGNVTHVGQLFFDEDLRTAVEAVTPYSTNTQPVTLNANDNIASQQAENDYDPFVKYAYLGDIIEDGLLAWITVGVDTSAEYHPSAAAELTENGGEALSGQGGGGGGPGGQNSGMSSGAQPSGQPTGQMSGPPQMPTGAGSPGNMTVTGTVSGKSTETGGSGTVTDMTAASSATSSSATIVAVSPNEGTHGVPPFAFVVLLAIGSAIWFL